MNRPSSFSNLLSPIEINNFTFPNRVIMGSMHTGLEDEECFGEKLAHFYTERAKAGIGLIITGGFSPNLEGTLSEGSSLLADDSQRSQHQHITSQVHKSGSRIILQILHAGRYSNHGRSVAPSPIQSPITPHKPHELSSEEIEQTIDDYVRCALLAKSFGYDGVEVMGSEGYLINQFLVTTTNKRSDCWGGDSKNRMRFPIEIVKKIREATGNNFLLIYRQSILDLIPEGQTWNDVISLSIAIQKAGADILNTGIGWHESRVPTLATMVPPASFTWVTKKIKGQIDIPIVASNRINTPEVAEKLLAKGEADMVSMARPLLADPEILLKSTQGREEEINVCIACNQACVDNTMLGKRASCLVNPRACYESELNFVPSSSIKRLAVVGGGMAGMSFASKAAKRGHSVTLFEKSQSLGGQFNIAKEIPGKHEFLQSINYFSTQLELNNVNIILGVEASVDTILANNFDEIIIATGVIPRVPDIPGIDHPMVLNYPEVLLDKKPVGKNIIIIGSGGIGFDMAEYLLKPPYVSEKKFFNDYVMEWGIDTKYNGHGGLLSNNDHSQASRKITMCQRKSIKPGSALGVTTGWIHRETLKRSDVKFLSGINYHQIDDQGLWVSDSKSSEITCLPADNIINCSGQISQRRLYNDLINNNMITHIIGGADIAADLDAKRAIRQGEELAATI